MPMKAECMSLVCKMVKVFFILFSFVAAYSGSVRIIAPTAAEPARNSRRVSVLRDTSVLVCFPSTAAAGFSPVVLIVVSFL